MEMFRSKSCRDGSMMTQMESTDTHHHHTHFDNGRMMMMMRSYSAKYAHQNQMGREKKMKKNKGSFGISTKSWGSLCDAELQRKKRVAAYKVYAVEGKVKGSIRKSFRWIKETCSNAVYGLW